MINSMHVPQTPAAKKLETEQETENKDEEDDAALTIDETPKKAAASANKTNKRYRAIVCTSNRSLRFMCIHLAGLVLTVVHSRSKPASLWIHSKCMQLFTTNTLIAKFLQILFFSGKLRTLPDPLPLRPRKKPPKPPSHRLPRP